MALLTTAGPGSMAAAMYLNLNRFSDAIFLRSLCPMHIYIYMKIDMLAKKDLHKAPVRGGFTSENLQRTPRKRFLEHATSHHYFSAQLALLINRHILR